MLAPGTPAPHFRLADHNGARATGINPGEIVMRFNAGPPLTVDLSSAVTAGNVADTLTAAIRQYESDHAVTILGPGGDQVFMQTLVAPAAAR